ncbi:sigma factor-like helix-turn-helix DNA-binding protein [Streptomyces sp. H10-C2]|uniref:sigma factor-like helix-turn-helix DNA-binding protein n=1 Tax=unclassified Streptomyces TaxID=2593676 RepID=UPI0024BA4CD6|nr:MULTISPECIES: sigma factor-like helix-turn-helix DNA-binding protein [unclassified Streptomyces]MDJ0340555.1 sigma factor-like helix-turn-helix DNA-binding protein [Streptomyces sp. PH10-H1]MDJ0370203.1 sigma factor-like helix-turn-helix DNA-binding protein [Streptomyces sp. H10-C2]
MATHTAAPSAAPSTVQATTAARREQPPAKVRKAVGPDAALSGTVLTAAEPTAAPAEKAEEAEEAARVSKAAETAFDALYTHSAGDLVRQMNLLTGNPRFARHAVKRAFDLAWQRWPEVAVDPYPVGWVRAAAYEYAFAPWQRWVPGRRAHPRAVARTRLGPDQDRALRAALLRLPSPNRQAILLYDGLGLDLPAAAAESEANTVTMANRITRARAALIAAVPELGEEAPARLHAILAAGSDPATASARVPAVPAVPADPAVLTVPATRVRGASERGMRRRTLAAVALTAVIAGAAGVAMVVTSGHGIEAPPQRARPMWMTAPPAATPGQGVPEAGRIGREVATPQHPVRQHPARQDPAPEPPAWLPRPPVHPPAAPGN